MLPFLKVFLKVLNIDLAHRSGGSELDSLVRTKLNHDELTRDGER